MKEILILALTLAVASAVDYTNVYFKFIGNSLSDTRTIKRNGNWASLDNTVYFQRARKNLLYINSYRQNFETSDVETIFKPYLNLRRSEWNLIYVDWSNYTNNFVFITTLMDIKGVAENIGWMFSQLKWDLYPFGTTPYFHLVGFGSGAHLAGAIGRNVLGGVDRITGLDPQGAMMYTNVILLFTGCKELGWGDARFVDIIHTSAGKFGIKKQTGHLDFWVNGGSNQDGCTFIDSIKEFLKDQRIENIYVLACSHTRAINYFAESVARTPTSKPFISAMCGLLTSVYNSVECTNTVNQVSMGYYAEKPSCGIMNLLDCQSPNYYVKTNKVAPFSMC